jgi:hypothetical protein
MWGQLLVIVIVGALFLATGWLRWRIEQPERVECRGHGCCHTCCKGAA